LHQPAQPKIITTGLSLQWERRLIILAVAGSFVAVCRDVLFFYNSA